MPEMSALTVWQPWASLIAEEIKRFEFRGWPCPRNMIGQRVAIHAGARPIRRPEVQELIYKLQGARWRETGIDRDKAIPLLDQALTSPGSFHTSAVLCTAVLGQPLVNAALAAELGVPAARLNDSDRDGHSNWGWPMLSVQRLPQPVPAKGAQGFWRWTPEEIAA